MLRTTIHEIAVCAIGLASVALFCAGPVILWLLVDGLNRLTYSWPP